MKEQLYYSQKRKKSVLDGFTITGGTSDGATTGGLYVIESEPTIRNCIIEKNTSHGLYLNYAPILMVNTIVRNNTSRGSSDGTWMNRCENIAFVKCLFVENSGNDNGYIIKQGYSRGTYLNCTIANNKKILSSDWNTNTVRLHSSAANILNTIITTNRK